MPLHYYHNFTRCVATDGSREDTRKQVGAAENRSVSYGWWEGPAPESWLELPQSSVTSAKEREERCVAAGMWGGALPKDWDNCDAELYAVYKYLERATEGKSDEELRGERILVLSDCKSMLQVMEQAWRSGDTSGCRGSRGAMLEAICEMRMRLGRVVCVWCPAHRGFTPNEYADMVAAAHAGGRVEDVSGVARRARSRDCVLEVCSEYDDTWVLMDRRCYGLVKYQMGRYVRRRLAREANTMRMDAAFVDGKRYNYGTGGIATDVVIATARGQRAGRKGRDGETHGVDEMRAEHARVGYVRGVRGKDVGLPHEREHERRLEAERAGAGWSRGPAERAECDGCPACRRLPAEACPGCGGWLGRRWGAAPACAHASCPGNGVERATAEEGDGRCDAAEEESESSDGEWGEMDEEMEREMIGLGGEGEGAGRDGGAEAEVEREGSEGEGGEDGEAGVAAVEVELIQKQVRFASDKRRRLDYLETDGTARDVVQTVAERLRSDGVTSHEDSRMRTSDGPKVTMRHVLGACRWQRAGEVRREVLEGLKRLVSVKWRGDSKLAERQVAAAMAYMQTGGAAGQWEAMDALLAGFCSNFGWGLEAGDRAALGGTVTQAVTQVQAAGNRAVSGWKDRYEWEMWRRKAQEGCRELMRVIMRGWREVADERRVAKPLGGAGYTARWEVGVTVTQTEGRKQVTVPRKARERQLMCDGFSAEGRMAIPAGTQARVFMEWIRLVEGGRRAAVAMGVKGAVRAWVERQRDAALAAAIRWRGAEVPRGRREQEGVLVGALCREGAARAGVRLWVGAQTNGALKRALEMREDDAQLWSSESRRGLLGRGAGTTPEGREEMEWAVRVAMGRASEEERRELRAEVEAEERRAAMAGAEGRAHTKDCWCARCWEAWSPMVMGLRGGRQWGGRPVARGRAESEDGGDDERDGQGADSESEATEGGEGERGEAPAARQGGKPRKGEWLDEERWEKGTDGRVRFKGRDDQWRDWLEVGQSTLGAGAGNGVFAMRDFSKGETITYYGGRELGKAGTQEGEAALAAAMYDDSGAERAAARYIQEFKGMYVEARINNGNPAHIINDAGSTHANATCKGGGELQATKVIKTGQEIFYCYGAAYWRRWAAGTPRLTLPARGRGAAGRGRGGGGGGKGGGGGARGARGGRQGGGPGRGGDGGSGSQTTATGGGRVLRQRLDGRAVTGEGVT